MNDPSLQPVFQARATAARTIGYALLSGAIVALVLALALVGVTLATHPRAARSPYIDLNAEDCPPPGANELLVITVGRQGSDFVAACTTVRGKALPPI